IPGRSGRSATRLSVTSPRVTSANSDQFTRVQRRTRGVPEGRHRSGGFGDTDRGHRDPPREDLRGRFLYPAGRGRQVGDRGACRAVATVQFFKGLKAAAIILVGLESLDSPTSRSLLYVGGSRARSILRVLLPRKCSEQVALCLPRILRALGTPSASNK